MQVLSTTDESLCSEGAGAADIQGNYQRFDGYFNNLLNAQLGSAGKADIIIIMIIIIIIIIIIIYIYHALINALSAHMIHINLNIIFCTHLEHSPTHSRA